MYEKGLLVDSVPFLSWWSMMCRTMFVGYPGWRKVLTRMGVDKEILWRLNPDKKDEVWEVLSHYLTADFHLIGTMHDF